MQRKTFTRTLIAAAAFSLLPLAAYAQTTKLTLGHGAAPGNPRHEASVKFAEVVKAKSGGRIEVQVAPSAQLGDDVGGFGPQLIALELTEGSLFETRTGEFREDALASLRDLGVKIAIDDFGTGYSSLSYLKRWRVDSLKIDRSFVRDIATDPSDHAIVSAIVAMARSLNIQVVAEGIETWQQLEILRNMGCQFAQGFLFAKPSPAAEATRYLRVDPWTSSKPTTGAPPSPTPVNGDIPHLLAKGDRPPS